MAFPVFDGHNDVLLEERSFADRSDEGHLDLARARAGGFAGGFFAIFTRAPRRLPARRRARPGHAARARRSRTRSRRRRRTRRSRSCSRWRRRARCASCASPPTSSWTGPVKAVMHIEGAEAIEAGLGNLPGLHARGLRSLGITWSRPNAFGHGVPFAAPASPDLGPGLTDAGRALVRACNELGILVDLAHLNERGFWDVAQVTDRPLVVTHACAHALVPSARNLTDEQLDAIGDSGGVVGVCFHHEDVGPHRTDIARQVDYIAQPHRHRPRRARLGLRRLRAARGDRRRRGPSGRAGRPGRARLERGRHRGSSPAATSCACCAARCRRARRGSARSRRGRAASAPRRARRAPETSPNTGTSSENGATTPGE